jgi:glutaredoxin 3
MEKARRGQTGTDPNISHAPGDPGKEERMQVTLYSSPTCGYCHQAERFLKERGVHFTKYDISADPVSAREVAEMTGQMAVPVITVDGQVVVGFDRPKLEQLLTKGNHRGRPAFGLRVTDASRVAEQGDNHHLGAYVDKVAPGYPGDKAGIKKGDIIVQVNSRLIRSAVDLADTLADLSAGSEAVVRFSRGGNYIKSKVPI